MGTWGEGVLEDDSAQDIYDYFLDCFNDGKSMPEITKLLEDVFSDTLESDPVAFWYALAQVQWECGQLQPVTIDRVKAIRSAGQDLDSWKQRGGRPISARESAILEFIARLESPCEKPRKSKKRRSFRSAFAPGDCVAV